MYGIWEKLRRNEIRQKNKGHVDPSPAQHRRQGLVFFFGLVIIFAVLVWIANR